MDNMDLGTLKDTEKIFCLKEDERINAELRNLARFQCDTKILETCNYLLSIKADNVDLLRKKEWMFNKGNVRDVSKWKENKKTVVNKRKYPSFYTPPFFLGIIPSIIIATILYIFDPYSFDVAIFFALPFLLLIALTICSIIYYIGSKNYAKYLVNISKEENVTTSELNFAVEQLKDAKAAVIATTAACVHTVRCAKNAQKELDNPKKWKKI